MKNLFAIKLPNGYLHSIEGRDVISTVNAHGAELFRSIHAARATVRFVLSVIPAHQRFKVYAFQLAIL